VAFPDPRPHLEVAPRHPARPGGGRGDV